MKTDALVHLAKAEAVIREKYFSELPSDSTVNEVTAGLWEAASTEESCRYMSRWIKTMAPFAAHFLEGNCVLRKELERLVDKLDSLIGASAESSG